MESFFLSIAMFGIPPEFIKILFNISVILPLPLVPATCINFNFLCGLSKLLSKKYNYPIIFSTKGVIKDPKYWEVLDPKLHAFQLSLISKDTEFLRKYETNTAPAEERLEFARELKRRGFWVSIRIQPCIDIDKALELVEEISGEVNYITVEHLKIDIGNDIIKELFSDKLETGDYHRISTMLFEMETSKKKEDIRKIKAVSKCPTGVGDNDLHYLSDSDCCCGIDTIGTEFDNWIKYNMTYISHHENEDNEKLWTPCQSCSECFFKGSFGNKVLPKDIKDLNYKQYVKSRWTLVRRLFIYCESCNRYSALRLENVSKNDDLIVYDTYVDDGFSGTDFDRPSFQRLLEDMKNEKIKNGKESGLLYGKKRVFYPFFLDDLVW